MAKHVLQNLNGWNITVLQEELEKLQAEYRSARMEHATKGTANPMELRYKRRNIARLLTELHLRELTGAAEN
jgi:ribosomal protein L29